jgi:hypothetical protein
MSDNKITAKYRRSYIKSSVSPKRFKHFWDLNMNDVTTMDFELTFGNANKQGLGFYSYYIEEMVEQEMEGIRPDKIQWEQE